MSAPTRNSPNRFADAVPATFDAPEKLPATDAERQQWQQANRAFWESNPMRYDWKESIPYQEGTREFYEEIDRRFFENVKPYMPWASVPFDELVPFARLADKKVLEIGVGMGSHAGLLSAHAGSYTGIDLTEYAVGVTSERLKVYGRSADIRRMDAEALEFADDTFDFIWSWGVIHHSSNTQKILEEMRRVLKPGGEAVIMVYNRGWWNYYICGGLIGGLRRGRIFRAVSLARTIQEDTDGALARYYSRSSWRRFASPYLEVDEVMIKGAKTDLFPIPAGRIKTTLMRLLPDRVARFMTSRLGMGGFLISRMRKR
ncbi:MAG: class I SAM-dependent methyltransferase [Lysobacter sp.]|nr:class I SAM-dependent methyltransferase [Lysobacter sp.]